MLPRGQTVFLLGFLVLLVPRDAAVPQAHTPVVCAHFGGTALLKEKEI